MFKIFLGSQDKIFNKFIIFKVEDLHVIKYFLGCLYSLQFLSLDLSLNFISFTRIQFVYVEYNYYYSNGMCYTMLCVLEWMRKKKHRVGTPRTQRLRGSALMVYIHGGIP